LLPKLYKKDETRFTYNQYKNKWSYVSCTIFAAVGMASDLTNYQFSYDEIKEIDDSSYDNPDYVHIRKRGQ
jgi:predicted Zn-dependent protease